MADNFSRTSIFGKDGICGVVAAPTAGEMRLQIRRALRHTQTIELRLDWLKNDREAAEFLISVPSLCSRATLIATCRRGEAGGRFHGGMARQLARLITACALGCQWSDIEIETLRRLDLSKLRGLLASAPLVASLHDFCQTPANLERVFRQLQATGADGVKIATECGSIADSLRVLKLARGRRNVIAIPMGEVGLPARVLALREGSALAYASVGQATAPGQLTLEGMKNLYRADRLDRRTKIYGVIGKPVAHSLSPLLHNTGFIRRGMNAVYLPFLVGNLRDFLEAVKPLGVAGFSVTLPHKERILRYLQECDPLAAKIGAVNTVVVKGGELHGSNTDITGILRPLERRMRIPGKRILICGAGGAARAAAVALSGRGAAVCVCSRRPGRARALARRVEGEAMARRHIGQQRFDVILNATPIGMHPDAEHSPLKAAELNCRVVFDLVYRPRRTKLLRLAANRGIQIISGVEMFLEQGFEQWKKWIDSRPPEAAMRAAVLRALNKERRR